MRGGAWLAFIAMVAGCGTPPPADAPVVPTSTAVAGPSRAESEKVCAGAPAVAKGMIARVVLRGGLAEPDLCRSIAAKAGVAVDEEVIDRDVNKLFATGTLADVVVTLEPGAAGDSLVYKVTSLPRIAAFTMVGGVAGRPDDLAAVIQHARESPLSRQATLDAEARIEASYFDSGYRKATVETELRPAGEGHVDMIFHVEPGPLTQIASLTVEGNTVIAEADLRYYFNRLKGAPLTEPELAAARNQLMDRYRESGRILAEVSEPAITEQPGGAGADVVFKVSEGAPFKVGKLSFSGLACPKPADRAKVLGETRTGATAKPSVLQATIARLQTACSTPDNFAVVVPDVILDEKNHVIDIAFAISAGPSREPDR